MGDTTNIAWTDSTLNWWIGCTEVTAACDNCYARTLAERYKWVEWGRGKPRKLTSTATHNKLYKWDREAKAAKTMRKVFCQSLSDVFDPEVPDEWRISLFDAMKKTTHLWFQVLTKRPALVKKYTGLYNPDKWWLGTSLGSDADLPLAEALVKAEAQVHWVSYEPAIGPLDVRKLPKEIEWVVVGGESGPKDKVRPFHLEWAAEVIQGCMDTGRRVFVKQMGQTPYFNGVPFPISDTHGAVMSEWPEALRVREFPDEAEWVPIAALSS